MGIVPIIKNLFPNATTDFMRRVKSIGEPRYMIAGDIMHWQDLRAQINPNTGRINSYRDIRKICTAEDKTVPSLGTLRNYLGEGGAFRMDIAKAEWRAWFEDFGHITEFFKEELWALTTPEEWKAFRLEYEAFIGYA